MSAPTEPVPAAHDAQGRELASYEQGEPHRDERYLPLDEVRKIYDIVFDHEYYAEIEGNRAQEDSYIDSAWEHAEQLVISGRTAADILATREATLNPDETTAEEYRYDSDDQLDEDTDAHSDLSY